jgi:3-dehydroquinate synthase
MVRDMSLDEPLEVRFVHRLRFTQGAFRPGNTMFRDVLGTVQDRPARLLFFLDSSLGQTRPGLRTEIETYVAAHHSQMTMAGPIHVVAGGERCKNDLREYRRVLRAIHDAGLCRHSYVVVIGGGAVLDAVGFAAATAHRGVRLIRFPTTTLSQADSGVGVKNGVNFFSKKNYLGAFTPPWAVINNEDFLASLSDRDWRCGFAEAVKVSLIKDQELFYDLANDAGKICRREAEPSRRALRRSAELHLRHIVSGGDPYEMTEARPLDFGHWSAHKLEQITNFRLRHGEAVAIGVALDTLYSSLVLGLDPAEAEVVLDCLTDLGFELYDEALAETEWLQQGLEEFREHLGGRMTVTMLAGIGNPVEVHEIDFEAVSSALDQLYNRSTLGARRLSLGS